MILKKLGAPCSLWEQVSRRSKKYRHGDCTKRWHSLQPEFFSIGSLFVLAKDGNIEMYERIKPTLKTHKRVFDDSGAYPVVEISTPFLTPKSPTDAPNKDQARFQEPTDEVMDSPGKKALIVRSRYGSGEQPSYRDLSKPVTPKEFYLSHTAKHWHGTSCETSGSLVLRTTWTLMMTPPFGMLPALSFKLIVS